MTTLSLGGLGVYSSEHGQVLDSNAMRVAQILNDYNPNFSLEFIPEKDRAGEAPYRVVDRTPAFKPNVVRYITHEEMKTPQKILAAIWKGDQRHHSAESIINDMELEDRAARMLDLKRQEEAALENEEILAFYIGGGRDRRHYLRDGKHKIER